MVEEKYGNLQEEAAGKTKKLQKINQMYKSAKAEVFQFPYIVTKIQSISHTSSMIMYCEIY